MRYGFTLLELTAVLALVALAASLSLPLGQQVRDRLSVIGAREDLVSLITRARAEALLRGGASLIIVRSPAEIRIESGGELLQRLDLEAAWRTKLVLSGGRPRVELRFNASGLGTMTARSITIIRGSAVARLIVSAFGRIRRE